MREPLDSENDSYDAARKVIPSIKAGREHAAYEIGVSEGRKQSRDEVAALRAELYAVSTASGRRMDGWQAAGQRALRAEAEVERMRPVVEAAVAETISEERAAISDPIQPRRYARKVAVDAFRAAQQETTDAD